jgi:outer membrane protein assembly factor BamB
LVFYSIGYGTGAVLLRQVPTADGGVEAEEIYPLKNELSNKHGGVVLVGDYVYGDSGDGGIPFCAELLTGEVKWKTRGSGKGSASVTAADGLLYIRYADGTMTLVKAIPDTMEELSRFKIPGSGDRPSWSHPVVCAGQLYLREGDKILCYELRSLRSS